MYFQVSSNMTLNFVHDISPAYCCKVRIIIIIIIMCSSVVVVVFTGEVWYAIILYFTFLMDSS